MKHDEQPSVELDPEKSEPNFLEKFSGTQKDKDRRERRLVRVLHTLQDHLVAIRREHSVVMSERLTADLLHQLEHSIKGVVRPAMHAALIVMAGVETPTGMVFSELAHDRQHVWSWMDGFKDTALCKLLSDAIKSNPPLQKALHLVDYNTDDSRGSLPPPAVPLAYGEDGQPGDVPAVVSQFLDEHKNKNSQIGLPNGKTARAKELLKIECAFQKPLEQLVNVNLVLATRLGEGIEMLRDTQRVAKQLGEIMFAKLCETKVNQFLGELSSVA